MENKIKQLKIENYDLIKKNEELRDKIKELENYRADYHLLEDKLTYYNESRHRNTNVEKLKSTYGTEFIGSVAIYSGDKCDYEVFHGLVFINNTGFGTIGIQHNKKKVEFNINNVAWWKRLTTDTVIFE